MIIKENKVPGDIAVVFCSDDYLLEMNRNYLQHDYYTDIITFDHHDPSKISGDLFISIDRVKENAVEFNVDFITELRRVMVHGVLHLCGFKDKSPAQEKLMRRKENYYLGLL